MDTESRRESTLTTADAIELIPQPKQVRGIGGALRGPDLVLLFDDAGSDDATFGPATADPTGVFEECREELFGQRPGVEKAADAIRIELKLASAERNAQTTARSDEAYTVSVEAKGVTVTSRTRRGLVYGMHTLFAIASVEEGDVSIPRCHIEDWPDFNLRGLQDDPARGQVSTVENFKRVIRELSRLKYNVLTFHTEDLMRFDRYPAIGRARGALTK